MLNLRCLESTGADISKGVNHVPPKYQRGETSGWVVVVPPDDAEPVVVELNVPA